MKNASTEIKSKRKRRKKINSILPWTHQRRSNLRVKYFDFEKMSDQDVVKFFLKNRAFVRRFIVKEKVSFEESLYRIRIALNYVDENDFASYVRLCHKAFRDHPDTGERLYSYLIPFIQEKFREFEYFKTHSIEEVELENPPLYLFPQLFTLKVPAMEYCMAEDFFFNDINWQLKDKYYLSTARYKKLLNYFLEEGLMPAEL